MDQVKIQHCGGRPGESWELSMQMPSTLSDCWFQVMQSLSKDPFLPHKGDTSIRNSTYTCTCDYVLLQHCNCSSIYNIYIQIHTFMYVYIRSVSSLQCLDCVQCVQIQVACTLHSPSMLFVAGQQAVIILSIQVLEAVSAVAPLSTATETGLKKGGKERSFFLILLQISASWKSSREEICGNKITQSHCPAQTGERRLQSAQDLSPAHVCRLDVCICKTLAEPLLDRSNIFQPNNDPFATPGYSQTSRCRNMLDLIGLVMFFRETTHLYSRQ